MDDELGRARMVTVVLPSEPPFVKTPFVIADLRVSIRVVSSER